MTAWPDDIARVLELLSALSHAATELALRDSWAVRQRWFDAFAGGMSGAARRRIGADDLCWHVFGHGLAPARRGADAEEAFAGITRGDAFAFFASPPDTVVRLDDCRFPTAAQLADVVLSALELPVDLILTSADFAWTMVFTHEQTAMGCGPFFAVRPDTQDAGPATPQPAMGLTPGMEPHRRPRRRRR